MVRLAVKSWTESEMPSVASGDASAWRMERNWKKQLFVFLQSTFRNFAFLTLLCIFHFDLVQTPKSNLGRRVVQKNALE